MTDALDFEIQIQARKKRKSYCVAPDFLAAVSLQTVCWESRAAGFRPVSNLSSWQDQRRFRPVNSVVILCQTQEFQIPQAIKGVGCHVANGIVS